MTRHLDKSTRSALLLAAGFFVGVCIIMAALSPIFVR